MAYVKIKDRNLKMIEVTICSKLGMHKKQVREDRRGGYIRDYIIFNNLTGTPFMIKDN